MPYALVSVLGRQTLELRSGAPLIIGRADDADFPISDSSVSRRHAELTCTDRWVEVRDLGSSNGTFHNGEKITVARLVPGDLIAFGHAAFRLDPVASHAPPPPPATTAPVPVMTAPAPATTPLPGPTSAVLTQLPAAPLHTTLLATYGARDRAALGDRGSDQDHMKFALLLDVALELSRAGDVGTLLDKILDFCLQLLDADRAAIALSGVEGTVAPTRSRQRHGSESVRAVPQSIARTVVDGKVAVLSMDATLDDRFGGHSVYAQGVRSVMCAPFLSSEGRAIGVLYVDNLMHARRFDEADLTFLTAFAGLAAVALENSRYAERLRHEAVVRSNFERYFAPTLARRIASAPDAIRLGGERRTVAVLFSDIRGFTALAEAMRPDEIAALLNEYFSAMVDCVFRHGGTLDKFVGDAILAQWGAPVSSPDDADRAVRAAVEMMRDLAVLNRRWRAEARAELSIGVGLSYGEAFAGNIGSERRLEYTVIGDTVNTAARLCAAAAPGEILLTDTLRTALTAPPPLRLHSPMELKGKSRPVDVYGVSSRDTIP